MLPYRILPLLLLTLSVGCSDSSNVNVSSESGQEETRVAATDDAADDTETTVPPVQSVDTTETSEPERPEATPVEELPKTKKGWLERGLTEEQYYVTQEKGTERAFTNAYWDNRKEGEYRCRCCGKLLFESDTKYKSGTGWPSFFRPATEDAVAEHEDRSFFSVRTEIVCGHCGAHLGHVFDDGPQPTGLRYCMNSAALRFEERKRSQKK